MKKKLEKYHSQYDIVFLGGGLWSLLLTILLAKDFPFLKILILEKSKDIGGNHIWSFFGDKRYYSKELEIILSSCVVKSWDRVEIHFPSISKELLSPYHSISSQSLKQAIFNIKSTNDNIHIFLNQSQYKVEQNTLNFSPSPIDEPIKIFFTYLFDSRPKINHTSFSGYQTFFGLEILFSTMYDKERYKNPVLMDGSVVQGVITDEKDPKIFQHNSFRFMYVLPFSENHFLIEDTQLSLSSTMNETEAEKNILDYAKKIGKIQDIKRKEKGSLPIPLTKENIQMTNYLNHIPIGLMGGGYFHPSTGYSLPYVISFYRILKKNIIKKKTINTSLFTPIKKNHFFYILINRFLLLSQKKQSINIGYKIFERFYSLPVDVVMRFYLAKTSFCDMLTILFYSRSPIPYCEALKLLLWK